MKSRLRSVLVPVLIIQSALRMIIQSTSKDGDPLLFPMPEAETHLRLRCCHVFDLQFVIVALLFSPCPPLKKERNPVRTRTLSVRRNGRYSNTVSSVFSRLESRAAASSFNFPGWRIPLVLDKCPNLWETHNCSGHIAQVWYF
ncbi:hypothetical protein BDV29DRAFT_185458 [Aspergillus leporis]|uniref:Uncharacterized protein n=1 Tax=Aspergillus leporis TaxID=41062 RepID=A0A5N5WHD5_9EURO|nr:hypothetical protein BDV29DRAFT_185458 [Aspergillus leporis]